MTPTTPPSDAPPVGVPLNGESVRLLMPGDEDDAPECDCADKVPADLEPEDFWTCPKCDAVWYGDDQ